jgi:hypothetical protein
MSSELISFKSELFGNSIKNVSFIYVWVFLFMETNYDVSPSSNKEMLSSLFSEITLHSLHKIPLFVASEKLETTCELHMTTERKFGVLSGY